MSVACSHVRMAWSWCSKDAPLERRRRDPAARRCSLSSEAPELQGMPAFGQSSWSFEPVLTRRQDLLSCQLASSMPGDFSQLSFSDICAEDGTEQGRAAPALPSEGNTAATAAAELRMEGYGVNGMTGRSHEGGNTMEMERNAMSSSGDVLQSPDSQGSTSTGRNESQTSRVPAWLPPAPAVPRPRATHNAGMLAYMGDSIFEMYARWHFLNPPVAIPGYCQRVMSVVCCEAQDLLLRRVQKTGWLTSEELEVLRWGRNANTGARRAKGRAGSSVYANATALETLIGFLYLTDTDRLHELMLQLGFTCRSSDLIVPESLFNKSRAVRSDQGGSNRI